MHRVGTLEVELSTPERSLGEDLLRRLPILQARGLAAVIDRALTVVAPGPGLRRIDLLEVDLGRLPAEGFEDAFLAALEPALLTALGERRSATLTPVEVAVEVVRTFALTGVLPWGVEPARDVVRASARRIRAEAPATWRELVAELAVDPVARGRLAREAGARRRRRGAKVAWRARLAGRPGEPGARWRGRRRGARPEEGVVLAGELREAAVPGAGDREGEAGEIREDTVPRAGAHQGEAGGEGDGPGSARVEVAGLRRSGEAGRPGTAGATGGEDAARADRASGSPSEPLADETTALRVPGGPGGAPATGGAASESGSRSREAVGVTGGVVGESRVRGRAAAPAGRGGHRRAGRPGGAPLASVDELYVEDAGIVLLWPFVARFFERVGLIDEERRFRDDPARHLAIPLLGALVSGDADPPEFLLVLPKVLCGLAPDARWSPTLPSPDQLLEAERVLAAAIAHAAPLHEMSVETLRRTFLARRGALSIRDGVWLLRVERHPYDIVLDGIPWVWSWVRLPWMPGPMEVEW